MSSPLPNDPLFLTKKERAARWIVGSGIGLAGAVGLGANVPHILNYLGMLADTIGRGITLTGSLTAIGLAMLLALNPRTWSVYMRIVNLIALNTVKTKSEDRLRAYVDEYLKPEKIKIRVKLDRARARLESANERLATAKEDRASASKSAQSYLERSSSDGGRTWRSEQDHIRFSGQSNKVRMLDDVIRRLEENKDAQELYQTIMNKLWEVVTSYIEVTELNIQLMVAECETAREMAEGAHDASGLLGYGEGAQLLQSTVEHVQRQVDDWMAEVHGVMATLTTKVDQTKVDDMIGEQRLLRELNARADQMLSFAQVQKRQQTATDPAPSLYTQAKSKVLQAVPVAAPPKVQQPDNRNRYRDLLRPRNKSM